MKFYFEKYDGTTVKLNRSELKHHLSEYQIREAIEAKQDDPMEEVSYMTHGGFIRFEL